MSDFMLCKWPRPDLNANDDSLAVFFDRMNEPAFSSVIRDVEEARSRGERPFVVSFSHFLPLRELMPPRTHMRVPCLAHASGSDHLLRRVLALRPDIHLFGHTHFAWDATVAGTRCVASRAPISRHRRSTCERAAHIFV